MKRALVLLLLVSACGGSSGGSSTSSAKTTYLSQAEAICVTANADLDKAKGNLPAAITGIPAYVHGLIDIARKTLTDLSALTPPESDAADVKAKLIIPLTQQLADGDAFAAKVDAAAAKKDNAALSSLVINPPTNTRVDIPWMKGYGFKACATAADTGAAAK